MVIVRRFLIATASVTALVVTAAGPALGAFEPVDPDPLREGSLVRLGAMATTQSLKDVPAVAIGWRERKNPGRMFMTFSTDGGQSFLRGNGNLRKFAVAGDGGKGLSLAVCKDTVWAGSSANYPGDASNETDVLISRRVIGGGASQVFVTPPSVSRKVRDVSIACVGGKLLAIAWLEKSGGKSKARIMFRDLASLAPAATKRTFGLGAARFGGGISVAATATAVQVVWTKGNAKALKHARFKVTRTADPAITKQVTHTLHGSGVVKPQAAAQGGKVMVAYTANGKVDARLSDDGGKRFDDARHLVSTGNARKPSRVYSVSMFAQRIVAEVIQSKPASGERIPARIESTNLGADWTTRDFGHMGLRLGVLRKSGSGTSELSESWLNNAATDTLRAQYETP